MADPIRSEDISVVVQGPVSHPETAQCLDSLRYYLPGAKVILSTWEGTDISSLSYDTVVLNQDPGAESMDKEGTHLYNINRMLLSSKIGLQKAHKPYVLRIRSDMMLANAGFLNYWDKFSVRNPDFSITKHKILTSSLYTIWCEAERGKIHPTPYHVSDWWHFGLTEDIRLLYSCPLVDIKEFSRWFELYPKPREYEIECLKSRLWQFPPEQYLGVELAKKKFPSLEFNDCLSYHDIDLEQSRKFILNNFIPLDYEQSGLFLDKPFYRKICKQPHKIPSHVFSGIFRYRVYEHLYNRGTLPKLPDLIAIKHNVRNFIHKMHFSTKNKDQVKNIVKRFMAHLVTSFVPCRGICSRILAKIMKFL